MEIKQELAYYTCDTIAECVEGVSEELYKYLWEITVNLENQGMNEPHNGICWYVAIEEIWHWIDPHMQKQINALNTNPTN